MADEGPSGRPPLGYTSLLTAADLAHTAVSSEAFTVGLAATSPDLAHVVLSSCAKLTADAIEVPAGPGEGVAGSRTSTSGVGEGFRSSTSCPATRPGRRAR
jgi:hypothetical protein